MNDLDKLNAERLAVHKHRQAERAQKAGFNRPETTPKPKPRPRWRQWLTVGVVSIGLVLGMFGMTGCTKSDIMKAKCAATGYQSGFCKCAFGPSGWNPDHCWKDWPT